MTLSEFIIGTLLNRTPLEVALTLAIFFLLADRWQTARLSERRWREYLEQVGTLTRRIANPNYEPDAIPLPSRRRDDKTEWRNSQKRSD